MRTTRVGSLARFRAAAAADVRLQLRNGFYAAAAFVAVCLVLLLGPLPAGTVALLLPPLVLLNLQVNTFYFIGGLVLLERAEGSLEALTVTPLRPWEYLSAKVATLAWLSFVEAAVIVVASHGLRLAWLPLAAGVGLASALLCAYGFVAVARYDSINAFLFPSMVYTAVIGLPVLDYLGIWSGDLWLLHPMRAPLVLLEAAFHPVSGGRLAYAVAYGLFWAALAARAARRAFDRHVVARHGDA